jgi:pimeloyl-ACP methyl ester carboxylesterase
MIPAAHGEAAHELMPGSRLEIFPGAGHFPFNDDPERFVALLRDFIATTDPAVFDDDNIRRLMLRGGP